MGYDEPSPVAGIPPGERFSRVEIDTNYCILDSEDFFVRCILPIPILGTGEEFCWGVWSSLSERNFHLYRAAHNEDRSDWDPMFGYLSNSLPGYPDTHALKLKVHPQGHGLRPRLELEPTDHPLAVEQREGVPLAAILKIVTPLLQH